jgi:hypothetical protein
VLLIHVMRRPAGLPGRGGLRCSGAAALNGGLVKFQFFAFDPMRLFYVNVDMPPARRSSARWPEPRGRGARARDAPAGGRGALGHLLAGIKFTDTEPLYGDQYGQIAVSLNPATPEQRGLDRDHRGHARRVGQATPGPGSISFTEDVRRSADRQADQREGAR